MLSSKVTARGAAAQRASGFCTPANGYVAAPYRTQFRTHLHVCSQWSQPRADVRERRSSDAPDGACRFDEGSDVVEPMSANQVYQWLLSANVPLVFEISNMFWDSVKRYLCGPTSI